MRYKYNGDVIEILNGELFVNGDFIDYILKDSDLWDALEDYYNIDSNLIALNMYMF